MIGVRSLEHGEDRGSEFGVRGSGKRSRFPVERAELLSRVFLARLSFSRFPFFLFFMLGTGIAQAQGLSASDQPAILSEVGIDQRLDEQIPLELVFRDEAGGVIQLGDYFGEKPVVLALVYYECPRLCTLVLNGLLRALRALSFDVGSEFNVVAVSIAPTETPALAARKRAEYVKQYGREGAATGWRFLTGEEASIQALAEAVGFRYAYLPDRDEYAHASGIMVATPRGRLARYFYGVEYSTRDLRLSLVEAAENKIGSPVDQLLLYCYHYDPTTGKYGLLIVNVIRLGGLATVIALGAFMLIMFRRDARREKSRESGKVRK